MRKISILTAVWLASLATTSSSCSLLIGGIPPPDAGEPDTTVPFDGGGVMDDGDPNVIPDDGTITGDDGGFMFDGGFDDDAGVELDSGVFPDGGVGPDAGRPPSCHSNVALPSGPGIGVTESYLAEKFRLSLHLHGCNATSYAQIPGRPNEFLGRAMYGGTGCNNVGWKVERYVLTPATGDMAPAGVAFDAPQAISGGLTVSTAYDATIESWNGELWAAWECAGPNIVGVSACVGPYNPTTGKIDPARTNTPIIDASAIPGDTARYSASVPKILAFKGHLYLYWTAVRRDGGPWTGLTTRGAELGQETSGLKRLWTKGTSGPVASMHPGLNVEVWGLGTDARSDMTADVSGVFTDGVHVFAFGSLGGGTCKYPTATDPGCYRLAIARSFNPLAQGVFGGGHLLPESELPSNTNIYIRHSVDADGTTQRLLGGFTAAYTGAPNPVPAGYYLSAIPSDAWFFDPQPPPVINSVRGVTYDQLRQANPSCTPGAFGSQACNTAASRVCRNAFGYAGGFGPVEFANSQAAITCVGTDTATRFFSSYTALAANISTCSGTAVSASTACRAAVNRHCQQLAHTTGISIDESSATDAQFACLKGCAVKTFAVAWTKLTAAFGSCSLSQQSGCLTAAHRYCKSLGYISGFGVQETSSTAAQVTCINP